MTALSNQVSGNDGQAIRRSRYRRDPSQAPRVVTERQCGLVEIVGQCKISSLPQLAAATGLSIRIARREARKLYDIGVLDVIAVPRCMLTVQGNDGHTLAYGSAPNIFSLTKLGSELLQDRAWDGPTFTQRQYGPSNAIFLAHELNVTQVYVWARMLERAIEGVVIADWRIGEAVGIRRQDSGTQRTLKPDALLVLKTGNATLVSWIEADRSTERNPNTWINKLRAYAHVFTTGGVLPATGYKNARVLVTTPSIRRRDSLCKLIEANTEPDIARKFWFAEQSFLDIASVDQLVWRRPGSSELHALL